MVESSIPVHCLSICLLPLAPCFWDGQKLLEVILLNNHPIKTKNTNHLLFDTDD